MNYVGKTSDITSISSKADYEAVTRVRDLRGTQIGKLPQVTIYKGNLLSAEEVLGLEHEHVVIATGSRWRRDGVGLTNRSAVNIHSAAQILTPDDLMDGRFPDRGPVVIFDDDHYYIGGVLAEQLRDRNLAMRLVTPGHTVSKYSEASLEAANILTRMRELGVQLSVHTNLVRVAQNELILQCRLSGETDSVAAAAVVLVTSREPVQLLYQELISEPQRLTDSGIRSVSVVGDAKVPGTIAAAAFDGHRYARELEGEAVDVAALPPSTRTLY